MAERAGDQPGLQPLARRPPHGREATRLGYRQRRMGGTVTTKTTELGDSRVRVDVEVASDALEREMHTAASAIGREMRVPGFRSGKVPAQVVIQQVGREAVLDEAVRRGLPAWYEEAITSAGITAVGDPQVDLSDLPERGAPLAFTIEVGIVPPAKLGEYRGLEVGRREPRVDPEAVQAELDRMRESLAALETVEREAAEGDFLVIDFVGTVDGEEFQGGSARGHVAELGAGRLIPGFEEQLVGARGGEERTVEVSFPDDYQAEHLAGRDATFAVEVKEVKEKRLPELDDDFAVEAGGYDSLDELRSEIEGRIKEADESAIEVEFREAAVDAVVAGATIEVPHELVHSKAHEMWHRTARRLTQQGLDPARYLEFTGKTEEELVTESEEDAEVALKREAVLAAIVEAEGIEVTDEEVDEALRAAAPPDASDKQLKRALKRARAQGADEALREDIAMRKAVDLIVEHAKPIPAEQAAARGKLWTPDKEEAEKGAGQIWTPGS
jgi:trigger factor